MASAFIRSAFARQRPLQHSAVQRGSIPGDHGGRIEARIAPDQNDSIEKAQTIPYDAGHAERHARGPERDVYRLQARPARSAYSKSMRGAAGRPIDPVIRVLDGAGNLIARSDDDPLLSLDPACRSRFRGTASTTSKFTTRVFPAQAQNFYRLKSGRTRVVDDIFSAGRQARRDSAGLAVRACREGRSDQREIRRRSSSTCPIRRRCRCRLPSATIPK